MNNYQEFCFMVEIHIGKQVKLVLEAKGISVTEFAKRINKSRENVYSIFNRKSIDTGLLIKISEVLEFDFFRSLSKSYAELEQTVQVLMEENELLKDYNSLLKKSKVSK